MSAIGWVKAAWAKIGKGRGTVREANDVVGGGIGNPMEKPAYAAAVEFGSREAYATIVRWRNGGQEVDRF